MAFQSGESQDSNLQIPANSVIPMKLGLEFDSHEDAYIHYNEYAGSVGFSIRKGFINKNKIHKYVTSRKITCYKEGYRGEDKRDLNVIKHRKETRTGCMAHIVINRQPNERYVVTSFEEKHNHPLVPPSLSHMLPSQRKISKVQGVELELADGSGIRPKEAYEFVSRQAGGRASLGYIKRDMLNHLRDKRKDSLKLGEAHSVVQYLEKRRREDPGFHFSLQLDEDNLITNIFWADTKMIRDYSIFGDVVSFDTTYRTNKNFRPLGLFVGMNNHREMVIFGAALLYDETIKSFEWLFQVFLSAMSKKMPKTLISDQDPAISKAVSLVMLETYHLLCIWHLEQNALKHLSHIFRDHKSFSYDFTRLIHEYENDKDFLDAWEKAVEKYDLKENVWMKNTFELRKKWSMAYARNTFSAGMRSTQLSESFNGSLRGYLRSDLDLVQFFNHFERAVDDKRYNEKISAFDMIQKISILKVDIPLLKHAREVYTSTMLDKFQEQWVKSLLLIILCCREEGESCIYTICTQGSTRKYTVNVKSSEMIVVCSCKLYDYYGILCSHSLKVLDVMNVKEKIPNHYILERWMKKVTNLNQLDVIELNNDNDPKLESNARYRHMCSTFIQISAEASESVEGYTLLTQYAKEIIEKLKNIKKGGDGYGDIAGQSPSNGNNLLKDSVNNENVSKWNGLKKKEPKIRSNKRPKSFIEKVSKKRNKASKKSPLVQSVKISNNFQAPVNNNSCENTSQSVPDLELSTQLSQIYHSGGFSQFIKDISCHDLSANPQALSIYEN